jgi:hypothetical protein
MGFIESSAPLSAPDDECADAARRRAIRDAIAKAAGGARAPRRQSSRTRQSFIAAGILFQRQPEQNVSERDENLLHLEQDFLPVEENFP